MTLDDGFLTAEQHRAAVVLIVHHILEVGEHLLLQQRAELVFFLRIDLLLELLQKLHRGTLGRLAQHVAREAVAHDEVVFSRQQVAALHVSDKVDAAAVFQKSVGFLSQVIALFGLRADIEERDAGVIFAVGVFQVCAADDRLMQKHLGGDVDVRAGVAHADDIAGHGRQDRTKGGSADAPDAPDAQGRGGDQRAGRAGRYQRRDIFFGSQHRDRLDHRAFLFQTDRVGGLVLAGDDLGRVDDPDPVAVIAEAVKLSLYSLFISGQHQSQVVMFLQREDRALNVRRGAFVAAEAVYNDLHSNLCYSVLT